MYLLTEIDYREIIGPLQEVNINSLFARAVVEKKVAGKIFVDNISDPQTFYIVHPFGMSLLFGKNDNDDFNRAFKTHALNSNNNRNTFEWMQAYDSSWSNTLSHLFGDRLIMSVDNHQKHEKGFIEQNVRVNFKFNKDLYLCLPQVSTNSNIVITKVDTALFWKMDGNVVPQHFWNNAEDFLENGVAFALFYKNELASMAFSSFCFHDDLEIGIETREKFREMGFAEPVCQAIINYCIDNDYEPIWSCRLENMASFKLAQKLGFEPILFLPYYRLSN